MELQEIIDSVDIVEYISQYIELKGNKELFGLSPFTNEKTPSFSVTPSTQLFYDFSSGFGGNILDFIKKYHKCGFKTAIEILKKYANIQDNYVDTRLNTTKIIRKYKQQKSISSPKLHTYLQENIMEIYENNVDKLKVWNDEGISYNILNEFQVKYDPVSNRIVFPIRGTDGKIVSIKGRTLNPNYKTTLINGKPMRKYTYFQEIGDLDFIFGYYKNYKNYIDKKEIIIFEGEKSVMLCETWGIHNTGAILTSHLNPFQLQILAKLGIRVVFALDKGINIYEDENIKKLKRFVKIELIKDSSNILEDKMAPVDKGKDIWLQLYKERKGIN